MNKCELKDGVKLIAMERQRQIDKEGWSAEHDDDFKDGQLSIAASCYAYYIDIENEAPEDWPWDEKYWKPNHGNRIQDLEKAGALIAAEIDRLLRANPPKPLIVKSGNTWIANRKGIDYLCVDPNIYSHAEKLNAEEFEADLNHWKSFTGPNPDITELTDEIAKLRPMVVIYDAIYNSIEIRKFTYIDETKIQCKGVIYTKSHYATRLATAKDLS